jgi:hypothetical protein
MVFFLCDLHALKETPSSENPFATPLQELIQQHSHIAHHKSDDIERKELCCVPHTQFQAHQRLRGALKSRIDDLASNVVEDLNSIEQSSDRAHIRCVMNGHIRE